MAFLLPVMAGCFAVLQIGINKIVSQSWGFSSALLLNGLVFLAFNLLLFALAWAQPKWMPESFFVQGSVSDMRLLWILPGIFGFLLVMGLTLSISQIGAMQTFIISIAAQIICSTAWDYLENKPLTTARIVGALVTFAGALIATR